MDVTGSSTEFIHLKPLGEIRPDSDEPISDAELAAALRARLKPLPDDEQMDPVVRGDDAIGT
jgi:hypothetical protein